jgi:hypothetical protein
MPLAGLSLSSGRIDFHRSEDNERAWSPPAAPPVRQADLLQLFYIGLTNGAWDRSRISV